MTLVLVLAAAFFGCFALVIIEALSKDKFWDGYARLIGADWSSEYLGDARLFNREDETR